MKMKEVDCTLCKSYNREKNRCRKTWFYIMTFRRKCRYFKFINEEGYGYLGFYKK